MTGLVTGASGFSGRALLRHFRTPDSGDIVGLFRSGTGSDTGVPGTRLVRCDLTDSSQTRNVIDDLRPEWIVHLAGLTHGTQAELFRANVSGTENLLDSVLEVVPACRVLIVSSSAVYGFAGREAIREDAPVRPLTGYGASKAAQEDIARARHARGAHITIVRTFNLVGPGQPESFLCGRIVRQAMEIEQGRRKTLDLLETRSYRDFIDVRDAVRAYQALVLHPDFGQVCSGRVFNVGSGRAYAVSDVISLMEEITGRRYVVTMPEDPPIIPVPFQQGDFARVKTVTGWQPEITLRQSLEDMLDAG